MTLKKVLKSYIKNYRYSLKDILSQNRILLKNKTLKNKYIGKRLFILGSGGSIKNYDLKQLKDEYVMTQNNFHVHPDIEKINPFFHCVVPYYQTDKEYSVWIDWIKDMETKLPNAEFFWGNNTISLIEENFVNIKNRSYYINPKYDILTLSDAKVDISKTIMTIQTATTLCLTVALYLGFSEIYLIGFDNDQICYQNKNQNRFYGLSKITDTYSEKNIVENQYGKNITKSWLNKWLTSKQLDILEEYSNKNGIQIFNASREGLLDNFERKSLKDIIGNDMILRRD